MSSAVAISIYGFMTIMIFLNVVVFGTEPIVKMFEDEKDTVFGMGCVELYLTAISGSKEWEYAKAVYDLKCIDHEQPQVVINERGDFYKYNDGGIISSTNKYDGAYELIPVDADNICLFKQVHHYRWCYDVYGEEGLKSEEIKTCTDQYYSGIRMIDNSCVNKFTFGWVDDFNRAVNEHEFEYMSQHKVKSWNEPEL